MPIRVVRVIQYSYPDLETAEADMTHWGIPANGSYVGGLRRPEDEPGSRRIYTIRSAVIPPHTVKDDDVPVPPEQKAWFENTGDESPREDVASAPQLQACPICGDTAMVRLAVDWQQQNHLSIPIIGCGNPWHYAVPDAKSLGDLPDAPMNTAAEAPHRSTPSIRESTSRLAHLMEHVNWHVHNPGVDCDNPDMHEDGFSRIYSATTMRFYKPEPREADPGWPPQDS